ncbi:retropepsin-like aspartic protease [Mesonia sp. K7]|uniref:retropepsin-like aspartic protease n=1 Tax=Mesonia sp. K7 TaxID=2218606 RepID=UPI000DAAC87B|nr:retropepsin-like aspartic protease [Mesonia sp. K7]PZD78424.1 acid protease [Mesonia sp. K7]
MSTLRKFLTHQGFIRIPLTKTVTNHFEMLVKVNGVPGNFILDTGASNSCIGMEFAEEFLLIAEDSDIKAAGAGSIDLLTQTSTKNTVEIENWKNTKIDLVLIDLTYINTALENHQANKVKGIIGADILQKGKAVIDYKTKCLYLK